jgi:mannose-6-phosphate isomerase-like protein (cupin superfamily)
MADVRRPVPGVTIRRLPVLDAPPATPVLDGVRIHMAAGEAAPVFNGTPWRFVAYLEFLPGTGAWRGNHYHEKKLEAFYVIRGRLEAAFANVDTGERSTAEVETGDVLLIEPRCAHAFRALEYAQVIECGTQDFDPTDAFARVVGR